MNRVTVFIGMIFDRDRWAKLGKWITWRRVMVAAILVTVVIISWAAYFRFVKGLPWPDWTGFGDYTGPLTKDQRGKTLWDWMELLIVPIVLAIGALWFNRQERKSDREIQKQRDETEREIAVDRQRESALQAYFDKMTELLLEKGLRTSEEGSEVRAVARTRTITTLRGLDANRKRALISFLREAKLVQGPGVVVSLENADLQGADLPSTNLQGAELPWANLQGAVLPWTNLEGANLQEAYLQGANLQGANLVRANLEGAKLEGAKLEGAKLEGANLEQAYLKGANLEQAYLKGANLEQAYLKGANLQGANLVRANLERAKLQGAKLQGANLQGAKLQGANLQGAKLPWTDLEGANLQGAYLKGAYLEGAYLKNANITDQQLATVSTLKGATMPDGTKHE